MADIRPADEIDFARFFRGVQPTSSLVAKALWRRRIIVGFGGALETADSEWLGFLELPAEARKPHLYRHVKQVLEELKGRGARVVKTWCDEDIPRAKEMMQKLGFEPTDEEIDGKVVWQWVL